MKTVYRRILSFLMVWMVMFTTWDMTPMFANAVAVTPQAGNIYYIKNKNSGMYLTVVDDSASDGANVVQATGTGSLGQRWILEQNADGSYRIHPATDMTGGISLDVYNGSTSNGANIQIWYFEEAPWPSSGSSSSGSSSSSSSISSAIDADGYPDQLMTFVSTSDGAYVTDSSSSVVSSSTSSTTNRWKLIKAGSDYYKIVNASTGRVLAPTGNSATSGANVVTTSSPSGSSQYWKIVSVKTDCNGTALNYKIVNYANTSLALTLSGSSYKLSTYSGSATQCFRFNAYGAEGFAGYSLNMDSKEKASLTGGVLGDVVYVSSLSDLKTYASGTTPYTIVISSDISASSLTKVPVGQNKTFVGKFGTAELTNNHFRCISSSGNVIFKNITLTHDAEQNENDDIQMYISNGNNFWIDHCTFTGHTSTMSDDVDKHMYVGLTADYVSVTGCYFGGHKYGLILGYPAEDGAGTYSGYPNMTICNNYFYNNVTRAPGLMRYGYFQSCYRNYKLETI